MRVHIAEAHRVVMGEIEWTPTQARVFSNLIDKVVPDLSASYALHEHVPREMSEMSRAELEAIAAGA